VKAEAEQFFRKAKKLLTEAEVMLGVSLNDAAGRTAYLAGFHAAQALVFERLGKVVKTHNGLQSEFLRLTRNDPRVDAASRGFLSRTYNLKSIADYETDPEAEITAERARDAIEGAERFVREIASVIENPQVGDADAEP
jgi:uncharacterized protein (UPF0332 family)